MRKKTKRLITVILMCVMVLSTNILVYADSTSHQCSFTYMGREYEGTTSAGTHSFIVGYVNGAYQYATCGVYIEHYTYVYRCECGAEYEQAVTIERHSSCGK